MRAVRFAPTVLVMLALTACPAAPQKIPAPTGFREVKFPSTFAWGTATAGWQNDGDTGVHGPVDSNWSRWMAMGKAKGGQTNPDGNGFFTRYADDAKLAADLGLDSFRLSADWSRLEPQPGVFDDDELQHLVDVLQALKDNGLKPVLTFYHWTVPPWVQNPDGTRPEGKIDRIASKSHDVVADFDAFVRHVIPAVKDKVDTYTIMNEPLSMVVVAYVDGQFPPGDGLNIESATDFGINLMYMHAAAYDAIHELDDVDADGDGIPCEAGITMAANTVYPEDPTSTQEKLAAESLDYVYNDWVMQALTKGDLDVDLNGTVDPTAHTNPPEVKGDPALKGRLDFVGVQFYGPIKVKEVSFLDNTAPLYGLPLVDVADYVNPEEQKLPHNGMGREVLASDFAVTIDHYAQWGLPIWITENGTTVNRRPPDPDAIPQPFEADEDQAAMYIVAHLWEVGRAIHRGVDIRGYFHWTLADNFEWVEGRRQHFGAYTVDFSNPSYPRTKNKMGQALQDVIAAGGVTESVWNTWVKPKFPTDETAKGQGSTTSEPVIGTLP